MSRAHEFEGGKIHKCHACAQALYTHSSGDFNAGCLVDDNINQNMNIRRKFLHILQNKSKSLTDLLHYSNLQSAVFFHFDLFFKNITGISAGMDAGSTCEHAQLEYYPSAASGRYSV